MRIQHPRSWGDLRRRGVGGEEVRLFGCFAIKPAVLKLVHSAHWFVRGINVHMHMYLGILSLCYYSFGPHPPFEISVRFLLE